VKRGKRAKAMSGRVDNGGQHRAFGFEDDNVTVRESEAAEIRALTEHFLHGDSQDALVAWLNRRGITTSYDLPWTRAGLRQLLTRERNRGNIVHNGVVVGTLPGRPLRHVKECREDCADPEHLAEEGKPIIDSKTFDRVLAKYAARRRGRPPSPAYLCSGEAVCGLCGKRLTGRPRANMKPYPDGEVKREYWCSYSAFGGCGRISVDQRGLDQAATELALAILSDPRHASQIEQAAANRAEEARDLDALIDQDEELARALADRLGRGEIQLGWFEAAIRPLSERLDGLREKRAALDGEPGPGEMSGIDWRQRWSVALPDERRRLLRLALRGRKLAVMPADAVTRANIESRLDLREPVS
jgi:hypothetical protein